VNTLMAPPWPFKHEFETNLQVTNSRAVVAPATYTAPPFAPELFLVKPHDSRTKRLEVNGWATLTAPPDPAWLSRKSERRTVTPAETDERAPPSPA
jgi:hypothetical protein